MELPDRIKLVRESLGHSQKDMAKAIDSSLPSIQNYESGRSVPGGDVIKSLVKLGFNANWLLTGEGEMKRGAAADHAVDDNKMISQVGTERTADTDPITTVIINELAGMLVDQKRAVLKFCMDINGEQYTLVKYSSQENREKRIKG